MYTPTGVPVIRGCNLPIEARFDEKDFVYVSEQKADELRQHSARPGDLIITQRGTLGQVGLIPQNSRWPRYIVSQSQMKLTVDRERADNLFLYYVLRSPMVAKRIEDLALRSGVPHINLAILRAFEVDLPSLENQHRIASILGAYDDLIEVNRRRIALLEEMAGRLFEEWFVRFRFPEHEGRVTEGELPQGWMRVPIEQVYQGLYDGPHATPKPSEDGPVFLGIGNITESGQLDLSSIRHIAEAEFQIWTRRVTPEAGDIVFTYEATLNRYAMIPRNFRGCLGRRLALIRMPPSSVYRNFLFLYFFSADWRQTITRNKLSGATVDRIPLSKLPAFPINLPPEAVAAKFDRIVQPTFDLAESVRKGNLILRAQRDLLLPRLISGEMSVPAAELELQAVA